MPIYLIIYMFTYRLNNPNSRSLKMNFEHPGTLHVQGCDSAVNCTHWKPPTQKNSGVTVMCFPSETQLQE